MTTIQVKLSNGTQHPLTLESLDVSVAEFKKLAAPVIDIPAENQRIVFKGKVLKDVDNLLKVGVEAGLALHVVRSAAAPTAAATVPAPAPAVVTPTPTVEPTVPAVETNTTEQPANPFAAIFGGAPTTSTAAGGSSMGAGVTNNAGMGTGMGDGLGGWAGMMGGMGGAGMGGAGGGNNPLAMLQNPMVMQMVMQMMQNPQYMQMMAANNPMLQGMSSQQRDQMMQLMANPQIMQMALQMMQNGGGMPGMAGMGGAAGGGMNANAMAQAMNAMSGNSANMQQFLAPPPVQGNPREIYRSQLDQLSAMGFPNEQANIAALQMSQGNVEFAIERLLNSGGGGGGW